MSKQRLKGWINVKPCPKCQSENIYSIFNYEGLYCVFCDDCRYLIKRRMIDKAIEFWNNLKREKPNPPKPNHQGRGGLG